MTPDRNDRKLHGGGGAGGEDDPDEETERTAKAPRTRGSSAAAGQRNASWSGATGRLYQPDHSSPGSYRHQQRGADAVGRLSSSTSARFGPGGGGNGYASSSTSAPTASRMSMGQRNTSSSSIPYNSTANSSFQGLGSPGGRARFSLPHPGGGGLVGGPSSTGGTGASQFLLTVVPPMHLPHDPPHPRTSQACSGYGPPEYFRRGTLIPLYPTLSSQLGAIAREYGLPSTGGLVLYLISTADPASSTRAALPGSEGFAGDGGPRIGEEAWSLLWGRLFQSDDEEIVLLAQNDESMTDDDEYAPPVPPIPRSHLGSLHNLHDDGVQSADARYSPSLADMQSSGGGRRFASDSDADQDLEQNTSFSSDADGGDSVYSAVGGDAHDTSTMSNKSRERLPSSSGMQNNGIGRGPPPMLNGNGGLPSPISRNASANASARNLSSYASQPHLRHASRQSIASQPRSSSRHGGLFQESVRSGSYSSPPVAGPGYGSSIIVGRVEFDIDWRRGGRSKWYSDWVEGAASAPPSSAASVASAAMSTSQSYASSAPSANESLAGDEPFKVSAPRAGPPSGPLFPAPVEEFAPPPFQQDVVAELILPTKSRAIVEPPSTPQPLYLPELVSQRQPPAESAPLPPVLEPSSPPAAVEPTLAPEPEPEPQDLSERAAAQANQPVVVALPEPTVEEPLLREVKLEPQETDEEDLVPSIEAFPPTPDEVPDAMSSSTPPLAMQRPQMRIRTPSGRSRAVESAASGYSIAAVAGHASDTETDDSHARQREMRSPSPAPGGMSTSSSLSSIKMYADSDASSSPRSSMGAYAATAPRVEEDEEPVVEEEDEDEQPADEGYAALADGDEDGSDYGEDEEPVASPTVTPAMLAPHVEVDGDPLADVFGNDEATWQSMADELTGMRSPVRGPPTPTMTVPTDLTDSTSLGIHDARVSSLAATAPVGVVEDPVEANDALETLPPQDDVADVRSMLLSGDRPQPDAILASPIHLDPAGPSESGVFTSEPLVAPRPAGPETPRAIATDSSSTSPPTSARRRNRTGGSDWSASSPTLESAPSFGVDLRDRLDAPSTSQNRDSTVGLMENLDDLERALADLSPKTSKSGKRELHDSPPLSGATVSTSVTDEVAAPAPEDVPVPASSASESSSSSTRSESRQVPYQDFIDTPPPVSPIHSDISSANASSSRPSIMERRPSAGVRQLSLTSQVSGYAKESPAEQTAPATPGPAAPVEQILEQEHRTTSPVADLPDTAPIQPTTPRTPRTSSLSRNDERTPRNIALPASPMPHPRANETSAPLPPGLLQQESGPAGLGIDFPTRSSSSSDEPPPLPTKRATPAPLDIQPATVAPIAQAEGSTPPYAPRSPGGRSLRSSKPWKTSSSDKGDKSSDSITGEKGPLGSFFTKPAFKFFNKKGDGPGSPTNAPSEYVDSSALAASEPQSQAAPEPRQQSPYSSPRQAPSPFMQQSTANSSPREPSSPFIQSSTQSSPRETPFVSPREAPSPFTSSPRDFPAPSAQPVLQPSPREASLPFSSTPRDFPSAPSAPQPITSNPRDAPAVPFAPAQQVAEIALGSTPPLSLPSSLNQLRSKQSVDSFKTSPHLRDAEFSASRSGSGSRPQPASPSMNPPDQTIIISSPRSDYAAPPVVPASPISVGRHRPKPKATTELDDLLSMMSDFGGEDEDVAPAKNLSISSAAPGLARPYESRQTEPAPPKSPPQADDAGTSLGNLFMLS
ncbi:hypothetical protein RQP46_003168 [Phenoliferia psychrophenolica]